MFDKYVIPKGSVIPPYVNLQGAIAFTRDTKHEGVLHKLFFILQKAYYLLSKRNDCDPNLCHGLVFLKPGKKTNTQLLAHAVFKGVITSDRNYLQDPDVTELVIYVPKKDILKKLVVKYSQQTSVNPRTQRLKKNTFIPFSMKDLLFSLFHRGEKPNRSRMLRTALATADLIQGNLLKSKSGKSKGYFCTPYAMSMLQSASITSALSPVEELQIKNLPRRKAAELLYSWIKDKNHRLGIEFRKNPLWQYDTRYGMSGKAAALLDKLQTNR